MPLLLSTFQRSLQQLSRRGMASAAVHHSPQVTAAGSASLLVALAGTAVAATVIAFAPPYEFDDLDCQSHCEQVCTAGVCDNKEHA